MDASVNRSTHYPFATRGRIQDLFGSRSDQFEFDMHIDRADGETSCSDRSGLIPALIFGYIRAMLPAFFVAMQVSINDCSQPISAMVERHFGIERPDAAASACTPPISRSSSYSVASLHVAVVPCLATMPLRFTSPSTHHAGHETCPQACRTCPAQKKTRPLGRENAELFRSRRESTRLSRQTRRLTVPGLFLPFSPPAIGRRCFSIIEVRNPGMDLHRTIALRL